MSAALDSATLEQAADWFARLRAAPADAALRGQWQQWLEQQEQHRIAWTYVERISQRFDSLQPQAGAAHQTLASLRRTQRSRRQVLSSLCVLSGGATLGWLGWQRHWVDDLQALTAGTTTAVGEVRRQVLADGTLLWLNSATALDVQLDGQRRLLTLYSGEVLIETAAEARPFQVQTRAGSLVPLGTRFSVRQQGARTLLNVYDGAVRATCAASEIQRVANAGQGLGFDASTMAATTPACAQRQAWSQGLLVAQDMPLGDFIAELADHRRGHLAVNPLIASLRVMGTYPLNDTDQVLAMLESALPVRVSRRFDWWVTLEPAEK